ncbi:hypothetical protein [Photobacterium leiognathi]|uniref:hypothetical protein n=1 Tax=Photobacterium leiognathi TaxID=553611 RepID=UPI0012D375D5|nr:hypothetical protein [Photobacterium leiognathi]
MQVLHIPNLQRHFAAFRVRGEGQLKVINRQTRIEVEGLTDVITGELHRRSAII